MVVIMTHKIQSDFTVRNEYIEYKIKNITQSCWYFSPRLHHSIVFSILFLFLLWITAHVWNCSHASKWAGFLFDIWEFVCLYVCSTKIKAEKKNITTINMYVHSNFQTIFLLGCPIDWLGLAGRLTVWRFVCFCFASVCSLWK